MITGGWEFVAAAYGLTWIVLGLYALGLWTRFRRVRKRDSRTPWFHFR